MKTSLVTVVNQAGHQVSFTWIGLENLGDSLLLRAHIILNFKNAPRYWVYDERARGWQLEIF